MYRYIFLLLFCSIFLNALSISSNDKYKIYKDSNYTIIYTDDFKTEAKFIKKNIQKILQHKQESFKYKLDEPLQIVLISNNIQIPNAFSTQVPFNMDIYFNGGSVLNNYFATKSYLAILLSHESSHNYQTNAKKSKISQNLDKYLGNNYMPIVAVAPLFTIPNLLLPTFLLEGNSVLDESLYQNGGRLYNGTLNAMKNSLIFHNKIDTTRLINDHLFFPYTTEKYIVGGYYFLFLASKYGIDKANQFFYSHSIHSINPLLLDSTFRKHFNISFKESINEFIKYTKQQYKNYKELEPNNTIATSKSQISFSKIDNKIYFLTSNLTTSTKLNIYDISSNSFNSQDTTLSNGKVFEQNNKLYTKKTDFISSTLYKFGLFDKDNYILPSTKGKDMQDITKNKIAYINIKQSFLQSKLYINDKFYNNINSNALFDKGQNIYYFVQQGNKRVLYKNKQAIFSFDGYYSKIADVVNGVVYFIANTKNGSTLYCYENKKIYKLINSDNIADAKILSHNKAIVSLISFNNYQVAITKLNKTISSIQLTKILPNDTKMMFDFDTNTTLLNETRYNELSNLQFSMLYPTYTYDSTNGSSYTLDAIFLDPVMFNMLQIYSHKTTSDTISGLSYTNERYIPFGIDIHHISNNPNTTASKTAGSIKIYGPLVKKGFHLLETELKYYIDDDNKKKKPIIFNLDYKYSHNYSVAFDYDKLYNIKTIIKQDRDKYTYGLKASLKKDIYSQLYANINLIALDSNIKTTLQQQGIKIITNTQDTLQDSTNVLIQGCDNDFYTKKLTSYSAQLKQVFDFHSYFDIFPISLRRESFAIGYDNFRADDTTITQHTATLTLDTLWFHKFALPIDIKYIKNNISKDDEKYLITIGATF